jgi:HlyD family secretion protein
MRLRNIIIIIFVVVIIGGIGWFQFIKESAPLKVELAEAKKLDINVLVAASGTVSSPKKISLNFKGSGLIEKINVKEEDKVEKDDILAELDTKDLTVELKQAEINLDNAKISYEKLIKGATKEDINLAGVAVDNAKITLDAAKRKLEETKTNSAQDIISAQTSYDTAKSAGDFSYYIYVDAQTKYEDLVKKYEHPVFHQPNYTESQKTEVDTAKSTANTTHASYLSADSSLKAAEQNLQTVKLKADVAIKQAQDAVDSTEGSYQSALASLKLKEASPRTEDVKNAKNSISLSQAALEVIQNKIDDSSLASPADGTIIFVNGKEGELISVAKDAFITMADFNHVEITANVDEVDIGEAKVNQKVNIALDAYEGLLVKGKVIEIGLNSVVTKGGGTAFPVKVEITSSKNIIPRIGMNADIDIIVETHKNVLAVPIGALTERQGKDVVFVVEGDKAKARKVKVGIYGEDDVEILDGLEDGEKIVAKNMAQLKDGDKIQW